MFNIIIDYIKLCFLLFAFMFILNAAYSQSPTMLSKSKSEEKVLEDINSESWILPQYFTEDKKEEISEYVYRIYSILRKQAKHNILILTTTLTNH